MKIKFCYKEYQFKLSMDAARKFEQDTGKDLLVVLMSYLECFHTASGGLEMSRALKLRSLHSEDTAARMFHALFKAGGESVDVQEVADAMYRVQWRPVEDDASDMYEPWTYTAVLMASQVDKQLMEVAKSKKAERLGGAEE